MKIFNQLWFYRLLNVLSRQIAVYSVFWQKESCRRSHFFFFFKGGEKVAISKFQHRKWRYAATSTVASSVKVVKMPTAKYGCCPRFYVHKSSDNEFAFNVICDAKFAVSQKSNLFLCKIKHTSFHMLLFFP